MHTVALPTQSTGMDDRGVREPTTMEKRRTGQLALLKVCERDPSGGDREGREMVRSLQESGPGGRGVAPGVRITTPCVSASAGDPGSQPLLRTARYALAW